MLMLSISFEQLIFSIFLNCIAVYMVKYIDSIISSILKNKKANKLLITLNVLIFIATVLLMANTYIH